MCKGRSFFGIGFAFLFTVSSAKSKGIGKLNRSRWQSVGGFLFLQSVDFQRKRICPKNNLKKLQKKFGKLNEGGISLAYQSRKEKKR